MDAIWTMGTPWRELLVLVLAAVGGAEAWHGLRGDPSGEGGLARRRTTLLGRLKGFRHVVSGSMLVGFGAALLLAAPWIVFLSLGFGFVELRESSAIIAALEGQCRLADAFPARRSPRPGAIPAT